MTDLKPTDTAESPYFYTFKVQCTSCRETHPNLVSISRHEMNDLSGSRGEANFVWKCRNCKRESSATIKGAPFTYDISSPARSKNIIEIDTRGLEFTEFKADVSGSRPCLCKQLTLLRESSKLWELSPVQSSQALICPTKSGLIMMRKQARKSVSKISSGRSGVHDSSHISGRILRTQATL